MNPVRIAAVRYLNTVPLIHGLDKASGLELILAAPSHIAGLVRDGRADIGLVSLVDAAPGDLTILPAGMIGCDGPTLTVRLYSSIPLDRITRVHADTESHTSVVLCRLLLKRLHTITPEIVDFDARERITSAGHAAEWPETFLLIGDKVVNDSPPAVRYPHQLDLGEAWKQLTGLPFVYAAWACRSDRTQDSSIRIAASLLDRQLRHNLGRLDSLIDAKARDHRWPVDLARKYLAELLRFRIGDRERTAADRFLTESAQAGWIPAAAPRWGSFDHPAPAFAPASA